MSVEVVGGPRAAAGAVDLLRRQPALGALALVGVAVLLVALWWGLRRLRRRPADRLVEALADREEVAVLMHPNPDPDAMACALGVAHLAEAVDTEAALQYPGQIRHQENRALETVLGLDLESIDGVEELASETVVLVDHNEARGFAGAGGVEPHAVVDHHPGGGTGRSFTDVRPDYGACATILAEYLEDRGWTTTDDDGEKAVPTRLATALLYGIQSDTKGLTRGCSPAEFDAAAYLYPAADPDSLDRIANPQVDAEVLEVKARAITHKRNEGPFVVSDVGEVSNVDAIAQAADELLRLEGTTAVVVAGERDGTLHLSGRSRDDRVHMGKTLRAAVEDIPMADAGGHARMGGGQLSIEHMEGIGPGDGVDREELARRVFDAMAGDV